MTTHTENARVQHLTETRCQRTLERTARDMNWGATDGALAIVNRYLEDTLKSVLSHLEITNKKHSEKHLIGVLSSVSSEILSLVCLQTTLASIARCDTLTKTIHLLGSALETEVYAAALKKWDTDKANKIILHAKRRHGAVKYRKQAVRSMASKAGFTHGKWSASEKLKAGTWLLEVALECPAFVVIDEDVACPYVTITEDALSISDAMIARLMALMPVLMPTLCVPPSWTDTQIILQGYPVRLVRKHDRATQATIKAAIVGGTMGGVLDALNAAQSVPYEVNTTILNVMMECYAKGISVDGLPPVSDLVVPRRAEDWDSLPEPRKKAWRKNIYDIKELNRSFVGQRLIFEQDMETAKWLCDNGNKFYTPLNLDYRGRVYGIPSFNFQRQDYVRSLFKFKDKKRLGDDGLYWLQVHLANCGDFDKVSKAPFYERVKWVENNYDDLILGVATDPLSDLRWTEADKPFLFLAACFEFCRAMVRSNPHDYECGLPVSFDGSCSGLQHLCAMTRAEEGSLVNLCDNERPQDVYQVVADVAKATIEIDLKDPKYNSLARQALAYGVNRSLVKRNVMTYSYSSKKFGMAQQLLEDTMKPIEHKVLSGELLTHPFGEDKGYAASRYLAGVTYDSIEKVVNLPAQAMRYLQGIARTLAHEGKPTIWHTPLGFPVVLRYAIQDQSRLSLFLFDKGVRRRVQAVIQEDGKGIDKTRSANGIAPSFVHSLDACHLQMVVLAAKKKGITSLALVHDSFGCVPADAPVFRKVIREEFYNLYNDNDVLSDIGQEARSHIETNHARLPELPSYGNLDLKGVLLAYYAFA